MSGDILSWTDLIYQQLGIKGTLATSTETQVEFFGKTVKE
jgi:hypothetical protein